MKIYVITVTILKENNIILAQSLYIITIKRKQKLLTL